MRFYLFALGCKLNVYELDAVRNALLNKGHLEVFHPDEADIIILNSCSVTATSDQKSRQHLRKFRRAAPEATVAIMGCYSKKHAEECLSSGADIVMGTLGRNRLIDHIETFQKNRKPIVDIPIDHRDSRYEEMGSFALPNQTRAYLKIQDGCDKFCAYCLIPALRGNSRSRDPLEARKEAKHLVEIGFSELVVSGVEIGYYGLDLGDGSYRLSNLLEDIMKDNPNLKRLRISSMDASEIDEDFLRLYREYPALADHLHLSLQSGSDSVLQRMRRHYGREEYRKTVEALRAIRRDIAISTDIIAGFPLESEEEWQETMGFASEIGFAKIHAFPFSPRAGTYAATLPDVPPEIKKRRIRELLDLNLRLQKEYQSRFYGRTMDVLFEEYDPIRKRAKGHTSNYLLVEIPSEKDLHGQILPVKLSSSNVKTID